MIPNLTKREEDILEMVITGMRTKDIAERLDLKPQTVSNYTYNLMDKYGVSNRTELSYTIMSKRGNFDE